MTNEQILQSDYLDILFENRNKSYGAYALRRTYDKRLFIALGAGLSLILLFFLFSSFRKKEPVQPSRTITHDVIIRSYTLMPENKPKVDIKPLEKHSQAFKAVQSTRNTDLIKITPDDKTAHIVPLNTDNNDKMISDHPGTGLKDNGNNTGQNTNTNNGNNTSGTNNTDDNKPDFIAKEFPPQFPGGEAALMKFLKENLQTPDGLDAGETKTVKIRFMVGDDGLVNRFEIIQSGGSDFDQEVIRVCKKMPRWKPAMQNGINVPVYFIVPVTFLGIEQ